MPTDFFPIARRFFNHDLWQEKRTFSRAEAWMDLLQSANWETGQRMVRGRLIPLERGQLIASLRFLGLRWRWSKNKVASFLRYLEDEKMVISHPFKKRDTHGTENGTDGGTFQGSSETIITLCKYGVYNSTSGEDLAEEGHLSGHSAGPRRDIQGTFKGQRKDRKDRIRKESLGVAAAPLADSPGDGQATTQPEPEAPPPSVPAIPPSPTATATATAKPKVEKVEKVADPRSKPVTDGYCAAYLEVFGSPYVHGGAKDGQALKRLLASAKAEDFPGDRLILIAKSAMQRQQNNPYARACKQASTIFGFCGHFSPIQAELNATTSRANGSASVPVVAKVQPSDLRATCDPVDFQLWLHRTYPRAAANVTPQTATIELVKEYAQYRSNQTTAPVLC